MPTSRTAAEALARDLLAAAGPDPQPFRVEVAAGGTACVIQVFPAGTLRPSPPRPRRRGRKAGSARRDVLAAIAAAGRPLTRRSIVRLLSGHGEGTLTKVLADLVRAGLLLNHHDRRGYRLPSWEPTGLF